MIWPSTASASVCVSFTHKIEHQQRNWWKLLFQGYRMELRRLKQIHRHQHYEAYANRWRVVGGKRHQFDLFARHLVDSDRRDSRTLPAYITITYRTTTIVKTTPRRKPSNTQKFTSVHQSLIRLCLQCKSERVEAMRVHFVVGEQCV